MAWRSASSSSDDVWVMQPFDESAYRPHVQSMISRGGLDPDARHPNEVVDPATLGVHDAMAPLPRSPPDALRHRPFPPTLREPDATGSVRLHPAGASPTPTANATPNGGHGHGV